MPLVSYLLLLVAAIVRPSRAQCPPGAALSTGVRGDGRFACWITPADGEPGDAVPVAGRVYCGAGESAETTDGVAVVCSRGALL